MLSPPHVAEFRQLLMCLYIHLRHSIKNSLLLAIFRQLLFCLYTNILLSVLLYHLLSCILIVFHLILPHISRFTQFLAIKAIYCRVVLYFPLP